MAALGVQVRRAWSLRRQCNGKAGEVRHLHIGKDGGEVATAVTGMHQSVQQIAFFFLPTVSRIVLMLLDRLHVPRYTLLRLMHVAYGREYRIHQYGQQQHPERRETQESGERMTDRWMHGFRMLPGASPVTQSRESGSSRVPSMDINNDINLCGLFPVVEK